MRTFPVALPLGLALGLGLASVVRPVGAADEPSRVAVVDVLDVINNAPRRGQIDQDFKKARENIEQFKRQERDRVEKEAGAIEILPKTDPSRRERERALNRSMVTSEFDLKAMEADARKSYFDALENLWREVRAEVRKVATENGFTVVLTKTEDELNVVSNNEFVLNVGIRSVLYYSQSVDLTNTVKSRLAAARPATPGGTPPPAPGSVPPAQPNAPQPNQPR